jgi:hypothetical protein
MIANQQNSIDHISNQMQEVSGAQNKSVGRDELELLEYQLK